MFSDARMGLLTTALLDSLLNLCTTTHIILYSAFLSSLSFIFGDHLHLASVLKYKIKGWGVGGGEEKS